MIYSLSLYTAGLLLGLFLIVTHGIALLHEKGLKELLVGFPRSKPIGIGLLSIALVWTLWLAKTMDLGEFTPWRTAILVISVVLYVSMILWVEEFLAVRALGVLALLAAEPLIEAAFLRPETSRLLVSFLAYVWVIFGLFWVGMPYLLRDQLAWVSKTSARWRLAAVGGLVYGAAVLFFTLTQYGKPVL